MSRDDAQGREIQALRDRLTRLSEVSLRINESLELDAVPQGGLDSARTLTGASYGAFVPLDDSGEIERFLASGLTAEELAARIRAALRRRETPEPSAPYAPGDLTIDCAERQVSVAGRPARLTAIERRSLAELASNAGRVLTYERLLRGVWKLEADADLRPRRTGIRSLRRILGYDFKDPTISYLHPAPRRLPDAQGEGVSHVARIRIGNDRRPGERLLLLPEIPCE